MATIQLSTLWLSTASNLSDSMAFPTMSALSDTPSIGEMMAANSATSAGTIPVRVYAGGVLRAINQPGYQKTLAPTLYGCTQAQVSWVDSHIGLTLLVRDDRGRRFYGQYYSYEADPHSFDPNSDITITIYQLTYSEAIPLSIPPPSAPILNPLTIVTMVLPDGELTEAYSSTLQASGGTAPYEWVATPPPGLVLNAMTGKITGTPTVLGLNTFTVQVTDSSVPTPQSAEVTLAVLVAAAPTAVNIVTTTLAGANEGAPISEALAATGGTTPYRWTIASGSLPAGVSLTVDGTIAGTPTVSGTFSFVVEVTDSSSPTNQTDTQSLSLTVSAAAASLEVTTTALPGGTVGSAYDFTVGGSGGSAPYTWTATGLPTGTSISAAGVITGTPTATGTSTVVLTATDSLGNVAESGSISLVVAAEAAGATLLGMFVSGQSPSTEESTASALGVTVTLITQYGNNSSPFNYSAPGGLGTKRLVVGLGAMSSGEATTVAESLVSSGNANAIIRLMWEMNGNWFAWGVDGGSLGYSDSEYISQWQTIYNAMKAVSGAEFLFCWNVNGSSTIPTGAYPGDSYVDIIGIDQYNYAGAYEGGFTAALSFAAEHSKPFFIGEWGCESGSGQTGDDPTYMNYVINVIKTAANKVLGQIYFGSPPLTNYPNSEAVYKAAFAGGAGGGGGGGTSGSTGYLGGDTAFAVGSPPSPYSLTLEVPSNYAEGDLLIAAITTSHSDILWGSESLPSGWEAATVTTDATNYSPFMVATHVCGASEPSSYTFTLPSGVDWWNPMGIVHLVGAGGSTASVDVAYNAASQTAPAATPANPGEYVVCFWSDYNGEPLTPPSGMTLRQTDQDAGLISIMSADMIAATTASTGTQACGGGSGDGCAATVLVIMG